MAKSLIPKSYIHKCFFSQSLIYLSLVLKNKDEIRNSFRENEVTLVFCFYIKRDRLLSSRSIHSLYLEFLNSCGTSCDIGPDETFWHFLFRWEAVKSLQTTEKFLQVSHFLLHSSIEHSFCLLVPWNNHGNKIFKLLFLCVWHFLYFAEKYQEFVDYYIN